MDGNRSLPQLDGCRGAADLLAELTHRAGLTAFSGRLRNNRTSTRLRAKQENPTWQKISPKLSRTFAASARNDGQKPKDIGLHATDETEAIPTDPKKKADAATKVLREGVLHKDQGADEAINDLPDRTRDADPRS